jgi:hypothetical protein
MERELGKSAERRRGRSNGFDLLVASFDVFGYDIYIYLQYTICTYVICMYKYILIDLTMY